MLVLLIAMSAAVSSQPAGYARCVAGIDRGALVKSQMLDCATREMDRADAALNARYRMVMMRLESDRRERLRLAERRWIDRRRARCLAAARAAIPSPEVNRMLCLVSETDARTAYLATMR